MAKLQLYSDARLPCPQRALIVLKELQLDNVEIVPLDVMKGEHRRPEFRKLHPTCALPFLVDSTTEPPLLLSESRAIGRYLAAISPMGAELIPDAHDARAAARFEQAASIEVTAFDPFAGRLTFEKVTKVVFGFGTVDEAAVTEMEGELKPKLDELDAVLKNQKYTAGDTFSLVDVFYMPYMSLIANLQHDWLFGGRPNLKAWWETVSARESAQVLKG